jgi:predicted enzyme related to lactoylglutathione lyase
MRIQTVTTILVVVAALTIGILETSIYGPALVAAAPLEEHPMTHFLGLRTTVYRASDLAKAKAWYTEAFGAKPYFDEPYYAGFSIRGYELGLVPDPKAGTNREAAGIAYWGVDDARAAYQRLLDLGAKPHEPITDVGGGILIGSVVDPFGNVVGVVQNPSLKAE